MYFLKILYISTNTNYLHTIEYIKDLINLNKFEIYEYGNEFYFFNSKKTLIRVVNYNQCPFNGIVKLGRFHTIMTDKDIIFPEEEQQVIDDLSILRTTYDIN